MQTVRSLARILCACSLLVLCASHDCIAGIPDMQSTELEMLAIQGEADAQFWLAMAYRNHPEQAELQRSARYWAERAAEQNHVEAQGLCAALYLQRASGPVSVWKSLYWYLVAACRGNNLL